MILILEIASGWRQVLKHPSAANCLVSGIVVAPFLSCLPDKMDGFDVTLSNNEEVEVGTVKPEYDNSSSLSEAG